MTRSMTGVMVEMLDYTKLAAVCEQHGLGKPSYGTNGIIRKYKYGKPVAAVVISSEGVCSTEIKEGMICLDTEWSREWQYLPIAEVEECRTGETRDLAVLVRTFGSRLDSNVYGWKQWAGVTPKGVES